MYKRQGKTHVLKAGQCILYEPGQAQHIIHYGSDDVVLLWLHFSGYQAAQLVEDFKLAGIHNLSTTSGFRKHLLQLARESRSLLPLSLIHIYSSSPRAIPSLSSSL